MILSTYLLQRAMMKKTFFALALLLPAIATAYVKFDVTARYAQDKIEKSITLTQDPKIIDVTHPSGIIATIALEKEEADSVEYLVDIKMGERELHRSVVKAAYNEPVELKCTAQDVDAELIIVASSVAANN